MKFLYRILMLAAPVLAVPASQTKAEFQLSAGQKCALLGAAGGTAWLIAAEALYRAQVPTEQRSISGRKSFYADLIVDTVCPHDTSLMSRQRVAAILVGRILAIGGVAMGLSAFAQQQQKNQQHHNDHRHEGIRDHHDERDARDHDKNKVPKRDKKTQAILNERKKEDKKYANKPGIVLIDRELTCQFCHEKFKDRETVARLCEKSEHIFHKDCVLKWEVHPNGPYYQASRETRLPNGALQYRPHAGSCLKCTGENGNGISRYQEIEIRLREHGNPDDVKIKPAHHGTLTDPQTDECVICRRYFKDGDQVVYPNIHADCSTNHILHDTCYENWRTGKLSTNHPLLRKDCYPKRGIRCPYGCFDVMPKPKDMGLTPQNLAHEPKPETATLIYRQKKPKTGTEHLIFNGIPRAIPKMTSETLTCAACYEEDKPEAYVKLGCCKTTCCKTCWERSERELKGTAEPLCPYCRNTTLLTQAKESIWLRHKN